MAEIDAATRLTIAPPNRLGELNPEFVAALRQLLAAMTPVSTWVTLGARSVRSRDITIGVVLVMAFPAGMLTDEAYQGAMAGASLTVNVKLKTSTLLGIKVATGSVAVGGVAMFRAEDRIIMVETTDPPALTGVLKHLLANRLWLPEPPEPTRCRQRQGQSLCDAGRASRP